MADNYVKIRIQGEADTKAFQQAEREIKQVTSAADDLIAALKMGVGIDLGGKLVNSLAAVPGILKEAIANGVQFNATLETARLGIAAIYRQFAAEKFGNFDAAEAGAGKAVDALRTKAATTNATFANLVGSYQATVGAMYAANISDIDKQVDTVALLANAVSAVITDQSQLVQETRAILTGNITADAQAAKTFGITPEDVARAKEAGQLYEFLEQKLSAFAEAGERGAKSYNVAWDNLKESVVSIEAEIARPVFEALSASFLVLQDELKNPEVIEALRAIGFEVAELVKTGADIITWALRNADALSTVAHVAGIAGAAFAAMGLAKVVSGLGLKLAAWLQLIPAIEAETAAVTRNTAAQIANNAARAGGGAGNGVRFANAAGGVATAAETAAARASMAGAYGATAGSGAAAFTVGAAAVVAGFLVLAAAIGIGIGIWGNAVREAQIAARNASLKLDFMGKNAGATVDDLRDRSASVDATTKAALAHDILKQKLVEEAGLEDALTKGDSMRVTLGRERLSQLEEMLAGLEDTAAINDKALASDEARAAAAERRAKAEEAAALESRRAESFKATEVASRDAYARAAMEGAATPADKLSEIERQQGAARKRFSDLAAGSGIGANAVSPNAGAMELLAAADKADTADNANKLRELAAQILGLEKDRLSTVKEIVDAQGQATQAEQEWREKRKAALTDLHEEQAIEEAKVNRDTALVTKLESQRDLRHDIKALQEAGLALPDAEKEAKKTADLKEQLRLKEQQKTIDAEEANNAVASAELGHSKRAVREAKLDQFKTQKSQELADKGLPADEVRRLTDAAADLKERQLRKADGIIGGSAKRSDRDTIGIDLLHAGRESIATPMSDSFAAAFHGGGVGAQIPAVAANAPQEPAAVNAGAPVVNAVKTLDAQIAAQGAQVAAAVNGASGQIAGATATITAALQDMQEKLAQMQAQIANLGNY